MDLIVNDELTTKILIVMVGEVMLESNVNVENPDWW